MRRLPQPVRVAGLYLVASLAWVFVTDRLVGVLIADPGVQTLANTVKGWLFVFVTTTLLFVTLRRDERQLEREKAAASDAERRFERIVETVPDAILLLASDATVLYRNAAAERLFRAGGGDPLSLLRSVDESDGDGDRVRTPIARALGERLTVRGEVVRIVDPGADAVTAVLNATPLPPEEGAALLVSLSDVTAEYRAYARLFQLSRLYEVYAETSRAVLALAEGQDILREACRIAVDVAGLRMAWVGMVGPGSDRVIPVVSAGHVEGYLDGLEISVTDEPTGRGPAGTAIRQDATVVLQDVATDPRMAPWRERALERGYVAVAATPLRMDGRAVGAFCVYAAVDGYFDAPTVAILERIADSISFGLDFRRRDEERRAAFERLESYGAELERRVAGRTDELRAANERLAQADLAKSQFLANMSHELRTPLNSIIGFTGILLQGVAGEIGGEQRKQLEMVYRSGKYLLSLVNDVLDLSRIEAGRTRIELEAFDLTDAVRGVVESVRPLAEGKHLDLELTVPDEPVQVLADRGKVQQVVTNLLSNAVKFTDAGSVAVALETAHGGRRFKVAVTDTGRGIPASDLPHIFEEFYQGPRPEADKSEGSGLGLAITRRLVRLMGGDVLVRSVHGEGSTFEVVLPVRGEQGSADVPPPPADGPLVLVVDDDPSSQALLTRWLQRAGMRVLQSSDAAEALAIAAERSPEVIVLDIALPGMNGDEALRRLKADPLLARTPVVCVSGSEPASYGEPRYATACLVKPVAERPFVDAVRGALRPDVGHNRDDAPRDGRS